MKRAFSLSAIGGVLLLLVFCTAATPREPGPTSPEIEELKKEVATLRERVDAMEKLLSDRQTLVVPSPDGRQRPIIPRDGRQYQRTPRGRQERWFNGVPYYVIPLEQQARTRARRSK